MAYIYISRYGPVLVPTSIGGEPNSMQVPSLPSLTHNRQE